MIFAKNSHEGFETFRNDLKMQMKMNLHLLLSLIIAHLIISVVLAYFLIDRHQIKVALSWFTASIVSLFNPAAVINFPNPTGSVLTTCSQIVNSVAVNDYVSTFWRSLQRCFYFSAAVYFLFPLLIRIFRKRTSRQSSKTHLRGTKLISIKELISAMRKQNEVIDLPFGEINMPLAAEVKSCFVIGRPGAGKTTLISHVIKRLEQRQEKVLIYDFKGDYMEKFYDPESDIIFNPLDRRSIGWNIFNEIESVIDVDSIAASLIPHSTTPTSVDPFRADGARDVFAGILHYLYRNSFRTNLDIWKMLTAETKIIADNLRETKGGEKGFRYLETTENDGANTKQALSVLAVMMEYAKCFEYMSGNDGDFSLNQWIESDSGRIFITSNANVQDSLRPILSLFIDLLAKKLLSEPDNIQHKTFFLLEEFGTLQRLPSIINLLTVGRSKGSSVWLGIQDIGRIESIYGQELRQTIVNACGNQVVFSVTDASTAKFCSDLIGETEFREPDKNYSMGFSAHKDGSSLNFRKRKEPLFLPSDISNLPDLAAIVRFSNYFPVVSKLHYRQFPSIAVGFELREDLKIKDER